MPPLADNDLRLVLNKKRRSTATAAATAAAAAAAPTAAPTAAPMSPPPPPPSFLTTQSPSSSSTTTTMTTMPPPLPLSLTSFEFSPATPPPSPSSSTPLSPPSSPPSSSSSNTQISFDTQPSICACECYCQNTPSSTTPSMNIITPEAANIMLTEAITHHIMYRSFHTPLTVAEATVNICTEASARLLSEDTQIFFIQEVACSNPWLL